MKGDAIDAGDTTNMDTISKEHSVRQLAAHGLAVGLNDGLMGNSEVGYVYICVILHSALRIQSINQANLQHTDT